MQEGKGKQDPPPGGQSRPPLHQARRFEQARTGGAEPRPAKCVVVGRGALTPPPGLAPHSLKKPCPCEPVTDVTGVAIRSPLDLHRGITDSHDQSADWSRNDTQIPSASVIARAQGARGNPFPRPYAFIPSSPQKKRWPGGHLCDCRKTRRDFPTKGLRSAARIICPSVTDKFHTGSPRCIFSHAHVARENEFISLPPAGGKLCEAFLTR